MQLDQLSAELQAIGLTIKQAKVYVASLFLGAASAQKIAGQAGITRPGTYDILGELTKLGLITRSTEGHKTVFVPAGSVALEQLIEHQAEIVAERQQTLASLLPQLEAIERPKTTNQPIVRFVRGKEGVDGIFAYALRKARPGSELLCMLNLDEVQKVYPEYPESNYAPRIAKKISSKQLYSSRRHAMESGPKALKQALRAPHPIAADLTLYEDKAVLLSYREDWTGIIIESEDIVAMLRQLFQMAWDKEHETS